MEAQEYKEKLHELNNKLVQKRSEYLDAKSNVRALKKEYSYEIVKKYEQYIGKKVIIFYKNSFGQEVKTNIGYLKEFRWYDKNMYVNDGLYPFLTKPKKDGSKSNILYPECDNTKANVIDITRIEVL